MSLIPAAPTRVMLDPNLTVQAGTRETLQCRAEGSYPEANITWTLNGNSLKLSAMEVNEEILADITLISITFNILSINKRIFFNYLVIYRM